MTNDSRERGLFLFVRGGELPIYYTDWREIISRVPKFDPNIRVKMFTELHPSPKHLNAFADIPTLAVVLYDHIPPLPRGRVIRNQVVSKLDQLKAYKRAGLPFPSASLFRWGMKLDTRVFGEFVVLKPLDHRASSQGHVELWKTEDVRRLKPSDFPDDHPIRKYSYLVQKYIHTGDETTAYRFMVFCRKTVMSYVKKIVSSPSDIRKDNMVATQSGDSLRTLIFDEYLDKLAGSAASIFPSIPLHGIDIIKCHQTGHPYLLENNCGGNVWHFSSRIGAFIRKSEGTNRQSLLKQYDCWNSAAKALVSATHALAQ